MSLRGRIAHAWNAFFNLDDARPAWTSEASYASRPDRVRFSYGGERTIIASIYTRMAIDAAELVIKHVRLDDQGRFKEIIKSALNDCLTVSSNIDQRARMFRQDIFSSMFEWGVIAIVPVETTLNPLLTGGFDITNLRVARVLNWYPQHVRVQAYNEKTGKREDITLPKSFVAIVENPFYSVMNEPNSTLQRLLRKLSLLDVVDEQSSSGKLDIIIQLPYVVRSESLRQRAEQRRKDVELQLKGSKYGIAYADGTEKITQLNRPSENNLLKQVEYLMDLLYSQLGITKKVMDGTADEKEMLNYVHRTIKPLIDAVVESMIVSFLTKTARTQNQSIMYFRDIFALVPISDIAEMADKLTRNEVIAANEIRVGIGLPPSNDPNADKLRNANMPDQALGRNQPQNQLPPPKPRLQLGPATGVQPERQVLPSG